MPGPSGVDSVVLQLDQKEEVRIHADRKGGATISQPFRPDATVALPDRALGDLLSEELRRLDSDEPYREALEAATGVTGLAERSPVREHIWFDPAEEDNGARPGSGARPRPARTRDPPAPDVVVRPDAGSLARTVAEELVARLAAAQAAHGSASVVLTGGGVGTAVLEQVAALAGRRASTGRRWTCGGATSGSSPRTTTTATRRPPAGPCSTSWGSRRSGCTPCRRRTAGSPSPRTPPPGTRASSPPPPRRAATSPGSTCCCSASAPEGHTASIFPESPAAHDERPVFAVRDCPKPPPTRVSLGFSAINSADEVWLVVAGEEKAPAVAARPGGRGPDGAARRRGARPAGHAVVARRRRGGAASCPTGRRASVAVRRKDGRPRDLVTQTLRAGERDSCGTSAPATGGWSPSPIRTTRPSAAVR